MKTEAKVGIFVFIGFLSLFLMSTQVSKFNVMTKDGYIIKALLNDATGLEVNSKVKVNGVEVGYVESFSLDRNKVLTKIFIYDGIEIPVDSTVVLTQDSILGSKQINIKAGDSTESLLANSMLSRQKSLASFDKTSDSIYEAANEFKDFIADLRSTLNEEAKENLQKTFSNFERLSSNLDSIILENKNNLNETILNLKNMGEELSNAGQKFAQMSDKFGTSADTLNEKLPSIMSKIDTISTNLKSVSLSLDKKLPNILTKFEKLENDVSDIVTQNKKPLNSAIKSAGNFFSEGKNAIKKVDKFLDGFSKSEIEIALRSEYQLSDEFAKSYLSLNYSPSPNKYYLIDVISTDDYSRLENKQFIEPQKHEKGETYVSAQFGKRYNDFLLRGGLIESTGGLGFDYFALDDNARLSFDIFDFSAKNDVRGDNPHAKAMLRYTFLKHIDAYLGYDNFLNSNADNFFVGAGVRFIDNDIKALLGSSSAFLK